MKLDLRESDADFRVVMVVPEGAEAVAEYGCVEIANELGFKLEVRQGEIDMAERKAEIEGNTMNTLQAYHVDEPNALLYETALFGQKEFHLLATTTLGGEAYYFEDSKGPSYTQEQVEAMLEACRTACEAEA